MLIPHALFSTNNIHESSRAQENVCTVFKRARCCFYFTPRRTIFSSSQNSYIGRFTKSLGESMIMPIDLPQLASDRYCTRNSGIGFSGMEADAAAAPKLPLGIPRLPKESICLRYASGWEETTRRLRWTMTLPCSQSGGKSNYSFKGPYHSQYGADVIYSRRKYLGLKIRRGQAPLEVRKCPL